MPNKKNKMRIAQIKLIAAVAMWGGSFISTKVVVSEVSPATSVWLRFLLGSAALGLVAWKRGELRITSWRDAFEFMGLGFLGITLNQWLQSAGLITSEASTTAWILASTPILIALLGTLLLKEKMGWYAILGILLAAFGVIMVVSKGDLQAAFNGGFGQPGDLLILLSVPVWAIYSILSCPTLERNSAIKVTFYTFLFGWAFSNVQFLAGSYWTDIGQLSLTGWGNLLFLSIFCSALAYIFYNDALYALPASNVAVIQYLEPLVATLISAVLLSERITLATVIGGACILFGVWLVNRNTSSESEPALPV